MRSSCLYFAYGSNMNEQRMKERDIDFLQAESGVLEDYVLTFNKRSKRDSSVGFANVREMIGEKVEGVLYLIREDDLKKLDKFEGSPAHYQRKILPVVAKRGIVVANVYVANEKWITEGLNPTSEYLEHLLCGEKHLTPAYFSRLKSILTTDI